MGVALLTRAAESGKVYRMECERCTRDISGTGKHDFCAICGKDLCKSCMEVGCCGNVPAISGEGIKKKDVADVAQPGSAESS